MEILGYLASLFIGVSLGLVGAGGSILTVPVMVYLFGIPVIAATSYSLFIVGVTSLLGTIYQYKQNCVNAKVAVLFSLVSLALVFFIRYYLLPRIPSTLFWVGDVPVTSAQISMLLFSLLMLLAARAMIRQQRIEESLSASNRPIPRLVLCGMLVGTTTGFLGAGGGFILIPTLVLFLQIPIKKAIGTSLLIIALNSLFGFALDLGHAVMDWQLLLFVTGIAIGGVFLGMTVGKNMAAKNLRLSFGWVVMVVGIVILVNELAAFVTKL